MQKNLSIVVTIAILALLTLAFTAYTVDQRQAAIKFRLGEIVAVQKEPGLYFRVPRLKMYGSTTPVSRPWTRKTRNASRPWKRTTSWWIRISSTGLSM